MSTESNMEREKFAAEMKAVIADAEELLNETAGQAGEKIQSIRKRVEETLNSAKAGLEGLENEAAIKLKIAAKETDRYVHDNPWVSIGIAAGVGLIAGWLLGRK